MNKRVFSLAILSTSLVFAIENPLEPCDLGYNTRGFLEFRGPKGVGYEHGYGTFGLFFSPLGQEESARAFIDLRGHVFTDGKWAANGGIGIRVAYKEENAFGLNAYYDFRDVSYLGGTHQVGAGAEYLTPNFDIRMNGYAPLGEKEDRRNPSFYKFQGHKVIAKETVEAPLPVIDAEVGIPIGRWFNAWDFYCAFGGYYLFESKVHGTELGAKPGAKIRVSLRPLDSLTIGGDLTYDTIFHVRGQGYVTFSMPLGPTNLQTKGKRFKEMFPGACYEKALHTALMTQPVYRNEVIAVEMNTGQFTLGYNDPCCCANFIFVDNSCSNIGNGTFERPYTTLLEAETFSSPGDIIYVRPGSTPYNDGIVLQPGQQLISSNIAYPVCDICLPACTPNARPLITNELRPNLSNSLTEFVGIVTSDNNTINGINIDGAEVPGFFSGIDINLANSVSIANATISNISFGIAGLDGKVGANIDISGVLIEEIVADPGFSLDPQFQSAGISIAQNSPLEFSRVNITNTQITGAPVYALVFNDSIENSQITLNQSQIFGGHRGVYFGDDIVRSNLCFSQNTISGIDEALGISTVAAIYMNGSVESSALSFFRNTFSSILSETGVISSGVYMGSVGSSVRNSSLFFDECRFNTIGTTDLGPGLLIADLEFSTLSIQNSSFANITFYGVKLETANGSTMAFENNLFQGIGQAGLDFSLALTNSSLAIQNNTFQNSPSAIAFWNQQAPITNCHINVSNNFSSGGTQAYYVVNAVESSTLTFYGNTILNPSFSGIYLHNNALNSTFLAQNNLIENTQYGIYLDPHSIIDSSYVVENNQISVEKNPVSTFPSGGIYMISSSVPSSFTNSSFVFSENSINSTVAYSLGIALFGISSVGIIDTSFIIENNLITNGDTGIFFAPVSGNQVTIDTTSSLFLIGNQMENMATGGVFFEASYAGTDHTFLNIKQNSFQNVPTGIQATLVNTGGSHATANISSNQFNRISSNSLLFEQMANPMILKLKNNETSQVTGVSDFLLTNISGSVDVESNSLAGLFSLQGAFCLRLLDNQASQFNLSGFAGSTFVESPNGQLSGVQGENTGVINPTNVSFVLPGTCFP